MAKPIGYIGYQVGGENRIDCPEELTTDYALPVPNANELNGLASMMNARLGNRNSGWRTEQKFRPSPAESSTIH